jgi:hypothetical protein
MPRSADPPSRGRASEGLPCEARSGEAGCQLLCIPPNRVAEVWPHVCGLIRAAAVKCRDLSSYQPVESSVLAGQALLWLVVSHEDGRERPDGDHSGAQIHAAVVTKLQQNERRKVCVIVACGGQNILREEHQGVDGIAREDGRRRPDALRGLCRERPVGMRDWLGLIGPIEDFARAEGCSTMRIIGRAGWARALPAYQLKNVVLEKEI